MPLDGAAIHSRFHPVEATGHSFSQPLQSFNGGYDVVGGHQPDLFYELAGHAFLAPNSGSYRDTYVFYGSVGTDAAGHAFLSPNSGDYRNTYVFYGSVGTDAAGHAFLHPNSGDYRETYKFYGSVGTDAAGHAFLPPNSGQYNIP